jgi:hypothetical protein
VADKRKRQCLDNRGKRYTSRAKAEEEILSIKIRSATNGAKGIAEREAQECTGCGGWHIEIVPSRAER